MYMCLFFFMHTLDNSKVQDSLYPPHNPRKFPKTFQVTTLTHRMLGNFESYFNLSSADFMFKTNFPKHFQTLWLCLLVTLRKITSFSTASAQLSKLRRSFVKASGIGTCLFSCRYAAFTQRWRKAGINAALTKSCRIAGFYAAFAKL